MAQVVFSAPTSAELRQKIFDRGSELEKLEEEIEKYKVELGGVENESKTLQNVLSQISLNHRKLSTEIKVTETTIDKTALTIEEIGLDVSQMADVIKNKRKLLADLIRELDIQESRSLVERLFSEGNISALFDEFVALEKLQILLKDEVQDLRYTRQRFLIKKDELENEKNQLLNHSTELSDKERILARSKAYQNSLLTTTKNKESEYKKILSEKEQQKKEFENELRDFSAQLQAVIDRESYPDEGQKVLSYPLKDVKVTQHFGVTADSKRLYSSGSHNGIDFRAPVGTKVFASADGTITGVGDTDKGSCYSYGKWVLIRHENGLSTLYAHLDTIKVSPDQKVLRGELVGYSGQTGYATGPHLHFGVYVASAVQILQYEHSRFCKHVSIPIAPIEAYLDPEAYLL